MLFSIRTVQFQCVSASKLSQRLGYVYQWAVVLAFHNIFHVKLSSVSHHNCKAAQAGALPQTVKYHTLVLRVYLKKMSITVHS